MIDQRKVSGVLAGLSNLVGFGLGYVYVGRIRLAFVFILALVGVVAVAGWSRLVLYPHGFYAVAVVASVMGLLVIVHTALIAHRERKIAARRYNRWWFYLLWIVASWLLSRGILEARPVFFGFEPFSVPSSSMAPTIQQGDYVMADTWRYDGSDPQFGDLVVFRAPGNVDVKYLDRVVGLPGDQIELRDDVLYRNGLIVNEPYIQISSGGMGRDRDYGPVTIPDDSYFVLGDNRHRSRDSRYLGPIDSELLHGRIEYRWFAFNKGIRWDRFPAWLDDRDD